MRPSSSGSTPSTRCLMLDRSTCSTRQTPTSRDSPTHQSQSPLSHLDGPGLQSLALIHFCLLLAGSARSSANRSDRLALAREAGSRSQSLWLLLRRSGMDRQEGTPSDRSQSSSGSSETQVRLLPTQSFSRLSSPLRQAHACTLMTSSADHLNNPAQAAEPLISTASLYGDVDADPYNPHAPYADDYNQQYPPVQPMHVPAAAAERAEASGSGWPSSYGQAASSASQPVASGSGSGSGSGSSYGRTNGNGNGAGPSAHPKQESVERDIKVSHRLHACEHPLPSELT